MRIASALGLVFAFVIGLLAVTQVSDLEDSIVSNTSGALSTFADNLTFLYLLVLGLFAVAAFIAVIAWFSR